MMSSESTISDALGKMPSLYPSARAASAGERSSVSGPSVSASNLQGIRPRNESNEANGLDREALEAKLAELEELVQSRQRDLSFSVDDDTGRTVVKVINARTDEVVRQIPSEEILSIARRIENGEGGMLELEA
ncbi:flagellar protein FlaG [Guyparkeria hydrothermalis]|uniref:flagellar protein FlaG n=1 Tax=Guyparkeria hydrothermalis TaxID=923 RepID=UPI00202262FD|nr:flagellar protein FlaG [Guyparkeria hydrothermalis]MCL7743478.1 flagellar protein FlaG [Guyparkeria hydrothermalis]